MKFFKHSFILASIFVLVFSIGCTRINKDAIDFGKFDASTYSNAFFNLKVSIPGKWYVMDDETDDAILQQGVELVGGENEKTRAILDAAEKQSLDLFSASESPPESSVSTNSSFMIMAENVSHSPGIKTGSDYFSHSKKLTEEMGMNVSFPKDIYEKIIDGVSFDVLELSINIGNNTMYQKQYATIIKKYVLLFVFTYIDDSGLKNMENILNTVSFR